MSEKKQRFITAVLPAACVLFLSVSFISSKRRDFSENENRYLAQLPSLSWETVKDGRYMEELSSYLADHFPFRDFFMQVKAGTEISLGKKEINGVYIAEDGYLIEAYDQPQNTDKIARILKDFAGQIGDREVSLMLVPTAVSVLRDQLPAWAPDRAPRSAGEADSRLAEGAGSRSGQADSQLAEGAGSRSGQADSQLETASRIYELTGIPAVDVSGSLTAAAESAGGPDQKQLFYKTDHHWTSYGAYAAYRVFCAKKGFTPVSPEQMERREVTHDFRGTLYSKVGDYSRPGDTITLFSNPDDKLTVLYPDTGETSESLYNLDYLEKKDKYSLFLNNIHPLVEITNVTADSDRELALIKDSYANSMVPFLVRHYRKIYVFDTRYYKMGPSAFIKEHPGITDVLLLYNLNTLDTDLGVRGIY